MTAGAPEGLKENVLIARRPFRRRPRPEIFQRDSCALKFASGQVDGKKWQHQVKTVGVAPQQDEIVVIPQRREPRLTAFAHVPNSVRGSTLASGCSADAGRFLLQLHCNKRSKTNLVRLLCQVPIPLFLATFVSGQHLVWRRGQCSQETQVQLPNTVEGRHPIDSP
jgi:hypothetical protein